jgi:hypothetical protein
MGSPVHPTAAQTEKLQAAGQLQELASMKAVAAAKGEVKLERVLPGESVLLYELSW